jgi:hypothetical protein
VPRAHLSARLGGGSKDNAGDLVVEERLWINESSDFVLGGNASTRTKGNTSATESFLIAEWQMMRP